MNGDLDTTADSPLLELKQIKKVFADGNVVFHNVTAKIVESELVLLTGPSGSGKTTLLNLIIAKFRPTRGEIFFSGQLVNQFNSGKINNYRRQLGIIFQDSKLIQELNVWENIALPLQVAGKDSREIERRVTDLLKLVSLSEKAWLFPSQLSGGESKKVAIARALANAPSLILADEPTGNLDKDSSLEVANLLAKINQLGTAVLLATHDLSLIEFFENETHWLLEATKLNVLSNRLNQAAVTDNRSSVKKIQQMEKTGQMKDRQPMIKTVDLDSANQLTKQASNFSKTSLITTASAPAIQTTRDEQKIEKETERSLAVSGEKVQRSLEYSPVEKLVSSSNRFWQLIKNILSNWVKKDSQIKKKKA